MFKVFSDVYAEDYSNRIRNNNIKMSSKRFSSHDVKYLNRIASASDSLPRNVDSTTVRVFKNRLEKYFEFSQQLNDSTHCRNIYFLSNTCVLVRFYCPATVAVMVGLYSLQHNFQTVFPRDTAISPFLPASIVGVGGQKEPSTMVSFIFCL